MSLLMVAEPKLINVMKSSIQCLIAACLLFLMACGGESKEHKILHQAADIHMEAVKIKKDLEPKLEELRQRSNSIQIQGRALTPEEIAFTDAVSTLEGRVQFWDENHVEVPGFDHDDHGHAEHNHDHSHDHGPALNLPAEDILLIQQELQDSIKAIFATAELLLQKNPN